MLWALDTKRKTCRSKRVERLKIKTVWRTIEIVKERKKIFLTKNNFQSKDIFRLFKILAAN